MQEVRQSSVLRKGTHQPGCESWHRLRQRFLVWYNKSQLEPFSHYGIKSSFLFSLKAVILCAPSLAFSIWPAWTSLTEGVTEVNAYWGKWKYTILSLKPECTQGLNFSICKAQIAAFPECQGALLRDFAFDPKGKSLHKFPCCCMTEMQIWDKDGLPVKGEWPARLRYCICVNVGLPQVHNSSCHLGHNIQLEYLNQKQFWKEYDQHEKQDKCMREVRCSPHLPHQQARTHYQQARAPQPFWGWH